MIFLVVMHMQWGLLVHTFSKSRSLAVWFLPITCYEHLLDRLSWYSLNNIHMQTLLTPESWEKWEKWCMHPQNKLCCIRSLVTLKWCQAECIHSVHNTWLIRTCISSSLAKVCLLDNWKPCRMVLCLFWVLTMLWELYTNWPSCKSLDTMGADRFRLVTVDTVSSYNYIMSLDSLRIIGHQVIRSGSYTGWIAGWRAPFPSNTFTHTYLLVSIVSIVIYSSFRTA